MAVDFEKQSYWHDRFRSEASFEWLLTSRSFINLIQPHITHLTSQSPILHLGCGTSDVQNHFRARSLPNVLNIDYEPLAAERGQALEVEDFGDVQMRYSVADATELPDVTAEGEVLRGKFALVVDKSTADAVACAGDDAVLKMAEGVRKCLAQDGFWISLSFSDRRFDVEGLPLSVEVAARIPLKRIRPSDPDTFHYCYLLRPT